MYAIEFETIVKDRYIKIPEYEKFAFQNVKVVLMAENEKENRNISNAHQKQMNSFFDLAGQIDIDSDAIESLRKEEYNAIRSSKNEWSLFYSIFG